MTPYHPLTAIIMETFPEWILLFLGSGTSSDVLNIRTRGPYIYVNNTQVLLAFSPLGSFQHRYGPLEDPNTDLTTIFEAIARRKEMKRINFPG